MVTARTGASPPDEGWYDPQATTFGDRLSGAREEAGLSQEDLAEFLVVCLACWVLAQRHTFRLARLILGGVIASYVIMGLVIGWLVSTGQLG